MPDGSSSAAPVINPGPRFEKNLRKRPCKTNARLAALAPGDFSMSPDSIALRFQGAVPCQFAWEFTAGIAVLLRRETNLRPAILPDSACLAKAHKRGRRSPALWLR